MKEKIAFCKLDHCKHTQSMQLIQRWKDAFIGHFCAIIVSVILAHRDINGKLFDVTFCTEKRH